MIRLTGATFIEAELKAPWSFLTPSPRSVADALMPDAGHVASCHVITEGGCTVRLGQDRTVELAAGDVVLFPRGDQHVLCRTPQLTPDALSARDISKFFSWEKVKPLRCGGSGEITGLVSGFFACDPQVSASVFSGLPSVMRISLNDDPRARWLQAAMRFSAQESAHPRAGSATMLAKLSELLFAEAIRRHIEQSPGSTAGWLAGLQDPHVARALALLHRAPQRDWTVEALAEEVGISRSALAERFARCVGQPPMQYLMKVRLRMAADRLLDPGASVVRVAEHAGYDSEASFSRAFKREFGLPPAAWRRKKQATA